MELYGKKSKSIPQKIFIVTMEIILLFIAWKILFGTWGAVIYEWLSFPPPAGNQVRNTISFIFSIVVFLRLGFMMFFLLKRKIPLEEAFSIPFAFSLYYIGFALLTVNSNIPVGGADYFGVGLFALGSFLNTFSELQRHFWKQQPENKGRLYTQGLFQYSMHINYFGDLLWVCGYAVIARNIWAWTIPVFLFCFFAFYNIPKLDAHLKEKYKSQYDAFLSRTKRFIPFIY